MKHWLALLLAAVAPLAVAAPDCGVTVERTLQSAGIEGLGPLFAAASPRVRADLRTLARQAGELSQVERSPGSRFREFKRLAVKAEGLPRDYGYVGLWFRMESSRLGPAQLQIALEPGAACQVLEVDLDSALTAPPVAGRDDARE